jgi:DNA-directed RNA polymerase specialized sigma24 family protein
MLEELAKNHDKWLRMAMSICGNRDKANDLTQDMYVKLHDCTKDINEWYIYVVMKSIFIDEIRANKIKRLDINSIIIADDNSDSYQDSINYEILKKNLIL